MKKQRQMHLIKAVRIRNITATHQAGYRCVKTDNNVRAQWTGSVIATDGSVNDFNLGKAGFGHLYQEPFKMSISCTVVISFLGIYPIELIRAVYKEYIHSTNIY